MRYKGDKIDNTLPFYLDDLGCSGTETNLLECLPEHNCGISADGSNEDAGVRCLRKGIIVCDLL